MLLILGVMELANTADVIVEGLISPRQVPAGSMQRAPFVVPGMTHGMAPPPVVVARRPRTLGEIAHDYGQPRPF